MRPTPATNRQDLYDLLAPLVSSASVTSVYDHEPLGEVEGPVFVSIRHEEIGADAIVAGVRIYSLAADDPEGAEKALDEALDAVEDQLNTGATWSRSSWSVTYADDLNAWVALIRLERGREDYG